VSKRTFVAFVVEPSLKQGLEAVTERDGIPVSAQVRRAIEAWLAERGMPVSEKEKKPAKKR
jgi:hypothetical protein